MELSETIVKVDDFRKFHLGGRELWHYTSVLSPADTWKNSNISYLSGERDLNFF